MTDTVDNPICQCGHGREQHNDDEDRTYCRIKCPCKKFVIDTSPPQNKKSKTMKQAKDNPDLHRLIRDILRLCRNEDVSIAHEAPEGSFVFVVQNKEDDEHFRNAHVFIKTP